MFGVSNEICTIQQLIGEDMRGKPTYSQPLNVDCISKEKKTLTRVNDKDTLITYKEYVLERLGLIKGKDLINGGVISSVEEVKDIDGNYLHTVVVIL